MLNFTTLKWKNLLSTGNYWSTIKLDEYQNNLIVGVNGSGKSTFLDALCFVLYNKPFRDINKPALINSINQKELCVEVEFSTENHHYKIVRGIKPDIFEIYKDRRLENQTASVDYQSFLEKYILKLNYKSFTQIVILGSASFTPFMQLKASDRRAIIEDLLDIQIFSLMNGLVKTNISNIANQRKENKVLIEGAQEKIAMQERYIAEAQKDAANLAFGYLEEKLQNEKELGVLKEKIEESRCNIKDMHMSITDKSQVTKLLKESTQQEAKIEANISQYKKTSHFYETETVCPTCAQDIDENFKEVHAKDLMFKIAECETELGALGGKILRYQARLYEIGVIEKKISGHELCIAEWTTSIQSMEKFNQKLDAKINSLKTGHESSDREQGRLQEYQQELSGLETAKHLLIEEGIYYDAAGILLKDTGIKTKIIQQYLPIINVLVNKFLASMDFFVNFNLDETFKETIKSRHRDEFTYHSFSEGEKQRIDMALMLTWRAIAKLKNSANTNLLILDEIFDSSLDANGADELMKILHNLEATNVFVISHKGDLLQDKFRNVVHFQERQNFSYIV